MIVVMPVYQGDVDLCLKNLELCSRFGDVDMPFTAMLHVPEGFNVEGVEAAAKPIFKSVVVNRYPEPQTPSMWPQAPNWAWQEAARAVKTRFQRPWFWWEQDATPIRPRWLYTLADAYESAKMPFAGHIVCTEEGKPSYMNGVGIYPADVPAYARQAMTARKGPFDITSGQLDNTLGQTADLSHLIAVDPKHRNVTFYDKGELDELLSSTAVIFHHCKDGSLYQLLTGRPGPARESTAPTSSFLEQTEWESGYFALPHTPNECHFNCSILAREDNSFLFTRRYRYPNGHNKRPMTNDLAIWRLSKALQPIDCIIPTTPGRWDKEQWEDPRVMQVGDRTFVSFANWVHDKPWPIRQSLTRLSMDWRTISVIAEPKYEGNAPTPQQAVFHEKNWTWFWHDDAWHCVYKLNPMTVFRLNAANVNLAKVWKSKHLPLPWPLGELRGGTAPIRFGNEFVTFFHSSQMWKAHLRRYYMGAVAFAAEPPFNITRMTESPLLTGSERDHRTLGGPLVVFPCGAAIVRQDWLVTFGVNDEACGWIKIPTSELNRLMRPLSIERPSLMARLKEAVGV